MSQKKGQLVVISGPSGVGKSTICDEVIKQLADAYLSVSITTRPKAKEEIDGQHYHFINREEFDKMIVAGEFVEYAEVFGNLYGTPKENLDEAIRSGKTIILEIDVQGAIQIKEQYPETKMIFILPPKQKDLLNRITGRGRDDKEEVKKRLAGASNEIAAAWQHYNNLVINEHLNQAIKEVIHIIKEPIGE